MRTIRVEFVVRHDHEGHEPFLEALAHAVDKVVDEPHGERWYVLSDSAFAPVAVALEGTEA